MKWFLPILGTLLLAACNPSTLIDRLADPAETRVAREYIQQLTAHDTGRLVSELHPSLSNPNTRATLARMAALMPPDQPTSTKLVGYFENHAIGSGTRYDVTYEFGYGGAKWVVVAVGWFEPQIGPRRILAFNVAPLHEPLEVTNALNFKHATPRHYVFAVLTVAVGLFSIITLIACIRTKIARHKWLWIIFIVCGVGRFMLNWTTGAAAFAPLAVQLLGASAFAPSIYSAWTVSFSIPVGAVLFWVMRKSLTAKPTPATDVPEATAEP